MSLWIEAWQSLGKHPKLKRAARELGVSRPTMVGHLMYLWWWAVDYAPEGLVPAVDVDDMVEEAGWDGDPGVFVKALVSCGSDRHGFLEAAGDGSYVIHDWFDHAGKAVVSRERSRELGLKGAHVQWHVNRGRVDENCPLCQPDTTPDGDTQTTPKGDTDSPPSSPPSREANSPPQSTYITEPTTPTEQNPESARARANTPPKKQRRSPSRPMPADWSPNKTHREIAKDENVNVNREALKFRDHAQSTDRRLVDWDKAFCNWLRRAREYGAASANGTARAAPATHQVSDFGDTVERVQP